MARGEIDRVAILAQVTELVNGAASRQTLQAGQYLLEPAVAPAVDQAVWELPDREVELALSRAEFRPPFEWLAEITIRLAEGGQPDHFLITETDVVAAQRRELAPLTPVQMASLQQQLEPLRHSF